ncbi:NADH-ubiquinone oxidoreductase chain N [hydrothermal vent metagenome]|uniref:NADH-ubiquinone oxidoreductase chain N n=1 Tax=hydrothermal vent metagenome TaxID=652676 RepID=A0A3B1DST7_9ZZZZ
MNFQTLLNSLISDTADKSLQLFAPELALCATVVGLLLVRLIGCHRVIPTYWVALVGAMIGFFFAFDEFLHLQEHAGGQSELFTGLLVYDGFTVAARLFLLLFLILVISLTVLCGIPDDEDSPDFYTLLIGATIGTMLMASANHLLILFLGIEMTSVPSYVMVAFLKGRKKSSEAALKYVVFGAGAAGVMLYGISLIVGLLGTGSLPEIAARLSLIMTEGAGLEDPVLRTIALAMVMILVGIAFKLSLFPFHFWCPDAFEGGAAEVGGFLSVASKAGAFALLVRVCLTFAGGEGAAVMANVNLSIGIGLGVIAVVSSTYGNLAAYAQSNIKRLLAYSTIAHAGYMLLAVAAMMVILGSSQSLDAKELANARVLAQKCVEGLMYYLAVYLFMNLGAFAVVAIVRNQIHSEEISDYKGLAKQSPLLSVCLAVCLFSLIGVPPLGGAVGKLFLFLSAWSAGQYHWSMYLFVSIAGLNTVFSLFYYLRVIKAMFMEERPEGAKDISVPLNPVGIYCLLITLPILATGMGPVVMDKLTQTASNIASVLF